VLETLDQTDWNALQDAYGPSTGTPARIRALASSRKTSRDKALEALLSTIYHQGTIYSASVAAVPFLLEIVAASEVSDRRPALQILQALSTGCSHHEAHASLFFNREKAKTVEWQEKVQEEKGWVSQIHQRLSAAVPRIIEVLQRASLDERLAAISLLATLQDNPLAVEAASAAALDPNPVLGAAAISASARAMKLQSNCSSTLSSALQMSSSVLWPPSNCFITVTVMLLTEPSSIC